MVEYNTPNIYPNLNNQQFRLNKISEVRDYFIGEIKVRQLMSQRLSKYVTSFDYFDKFLAGNISIESFATVVGAPVGIT